MKALRVAIPLLLSASPLLLWGQSGTVAAADFAGGVQWSIEGVASNVFGDASNTVVEGFDFLGEISNAGIGEVAADSGTRLSVYPNPFVSSLSISNDSMCHCAWSVYSSDGRMLLSGEGDDAVVMIDASSLECGVYLVSVENDGAKHSFLVVKK